MSIGKKIALSAFACDPLKGSEPSNGWNWAIGLAKRGFEVHCFTRVIGKPGIETKNSFPNLVFHYITLPFGLEKLYKFSTIGMYIYYILWQWVAYRQARKIHSKISFDLSHHVTWGSTQMGSFMYKLPIPFVFGPAGGGQHAPTQFKKYFSSYWDIEEKRKRMSSLLLKYNPACKKMLKSAYCILVSNPDTEAMVKLVGSSKIVSTLDAALAKDFFPSTLEYKNPQKGKLRLLWVGRFMPRKGLILVLDVMKSLKGYPGITLTVIGDGEMQYDFLHKITEYQLEDVVDWKGTVSHEEVKIYYQTHDVFFFTSLRDSCPAQLIEAMAYGLPVVTIDLHGQSIIVNDDTGFRCKCDTPNEAILNLKDAILSLYNDSNLVLAKSEAAYKFALQQTWDNKIAHIIQNYYPAL
jgi:glycosyltransferase involved in cell wall biosynthesis